MDTPCYPNHAASLGFHLAFVFIGKGVINLLLLALQLYFLVSRLRVEHGIKINKIRLSLFHFLHVFFQDFDNLFEEGLQLRFTSLLAFEARELLFWKHFFDNSTKARGI